MRTGLQRINLHVQLSSFTTVETHVGPQNNVTGFTGFRCLQDEQIFYKKVMKQIQQDSLSPWRPEDDPYSEERNGDLLENVGDQ